MAALKWTEEAEVTLRDIYEYIARTRPETARRTVESIVNKIESLADYPDHGQRYGHDRPWRVYRIPFGQFRIAYAIADNDDIVILGVFNGLIFLPLK